MTIDWKALAECPAANCAACGRRVSKAARANGLAVLNHGSQKWTCQRCAASPRTIESMFLDKIEPEPNSGCWIWIGSRGRQGYGHFWWGGKCLKAHRASYMLHVGEIPPGLDIMHRCDNPSCVNPEHLRAATTRENVQDMWAKGRGRPARRAANGNARLTEFGRQYVVDMLLLGFPTSKIADKCGIATSTVRRIARGEIWRAGA